MKNLMIMEKSERENLWKAILKLSMYLAAFVGMFMYGGFYSEAANLAKNASVWVTDQLFWIGFIIVAVVLVGCLLKKAWVQAVIVFVCGAVVLYLIGNPDAIKSVGDFVGNQVINGQ